MTNQELQEQEPVEFLRECSNVVFYDEEDGLTVRTNDAGTGKFNEMELDFDGGPAFHLSPGGVRTFMAMSDAVGALRVAQLVRNSMEAGDELSGVTTIRK